MSLLAERFRAARAHPPLAVVSATAARELDDALSRASELEDLPGKWQAALFQAESAAAGAPESPATRSCCGGGAKTPARA